MSHTSKSGQRSFIRKVLRGCGEVGLMHGLNETVVQLLLNQGANVNAQGGQYGTALQAASMEGHEAVVQLFLNQGANVNAQGGHYGTALLVVARFGSAFGGKQACSNAEPEIGKNIPDPSLRGKFKAVSMLWDDGVSTLAKACEIPFPTTRALKNPAARDGRTASGSNAFERRTEPERVFRFKVRELPEPNAAFRFGVQAFRHYALQAVSVEGHEAVVQLLLNQSANGGYYGHALQAASYEGHEAVVQLLLNRGADVNAQGGQFGTAVQAASTNGHEEVIQLLLENGALLNEDFESDEEEKDGRLSARQTTLKAESHQINKTTVSFNDERVGASYDKRTVIQQGRRQGKTEYKYCGDKTLCFPPFSLPPPSLILFSQSLRVEVVVLNSSTRNNALESATITDTSRWRTRDHFSNSVYGTGGYSCSFLRNYSDIPVGKLPIFGGDLIVRNYMHAVLAFLMN
ncbi:hypothetical protein C8J57DRAFT_1222168 [Mycena rebaudengoi]|nr:hypothetical protein C8J57DRAFT_1222168 [Mycena rebaudengoi]